MKPKANNKNIIINYGIILGALSVTIQVVKYAMNRHLEQEYISSVVGFVLMVILITLGIKKIKQLNGGFLVFGNAVKVGVGIAVVASILGIIYQLVFINFIEPDFFDKVLEIQNEKLLDKGISEEQIEESNKIAKKFMNPFLTSSISLLMAAFFGFIISAVVGAIMQKNKQQYGGL